MADLRGLGNDFQRRLLKKLTPIKRLQASGFDPKSSLRYPQGIKKRSDEAIFTMFTRYLEIASLRSQ
jgi:hypothetical protein